MINSKPYFKLLEFLEMAERFSASELFFWDGRVTGFNNKEKVFEVNNFPLFSFENILLYLPKRILIKNKVFLLEKNILKTKNLSLLKINLWPEKYSLAPLSWLLSELERYLKELKTLNFIIGEDPLSRKAFIKELNKRLPKFSKKPVLAKLPLLEFLLEEPYKDSVWFFPAHLWQLDLEILPLLRNLGVPCFLEARSFYKTQPLDSIFRVKILKKLCPFCKEKEPLPKKAFLKLLKGIDKKDLQRFAIRKPELYKKRGCRDCDFQGYRGEYLVWETNFSLLPFAKSLPLLALAGEIDQEQALGE